MFKKILVPLDGSELAAHALEPASELAKHVNGELLLMSVAADSHCTVHVAVKEGDTASVIVDTTAEEDIDLIVMSTHGRSGFTRWMMGSVTTKVLHKTTCPVLAVRSAEPICRVLITLDGSELAEQALEPGFEVARRLGAQVTLLTVQEEAEIDSETIRQLERAEKGLGKREKHRIYERDEAYLQDLAFRYEAATDVKTQIAVADGPVAPGILHFAENWHANLIVMATHGRTGLRRWVYGSVTEKILHSAHCGMMIIRPPEHKLN
jgi:nucleotide-binding universal stress UspA family protein